jgi:ubiquinone/menaquinone biosynthesis C-methylase UbiE
MTSLKKFSNQDISNYYDQIAKDYGIIYGDDIHQTKFQPFTMELMRAREMYFMSNLVNESNVQKIVLDIGCGTGYHSKLIQSIFPDSIVVGLDLSYKMLHIANLSSEVANIQFLQSPVENLPFKDHSFSASMCFFGALYHSAFYHNAIKELYRVLMPGGKFVISVLNRWRWLRLLKATTQGRPKWLVDAVLHRDASLMDEMGGEISVWTHYFSLNEITNLFRDTGFHNIKSYGQFFLISPVYEQTETISVPPRIPMLAKAEKKLSRLPFFTFFSDLIYLTGIK